MGIVSNASEDEKSSEYYISNETFCFNLEKELTQLEFENITGKYNAWSYIVTANRSDKQKSVHVTYKKSTYTSGNLLLSSEKQNLSCIVEWKIEVDKGVSDFKIRQRKWTDLLPLVKSYKLSDFKRYVITQSNVDDKFVNILTGCLQLLFTERKVYEIEVVNGKLCISLRTKDQHMDMLKSLINELII